jgi:hypothetical protein
VVAILSRERNLAVGNANSADGTKDQIIHSTFDSLAFADMQTPSTT